MPCQSSPASGQPSLPASYQTLSECLQACKEGACCEGTTCTVKPQCQCHGAGKVFKGIGTTCSPNPCPVPCCTPESAVCNDTMSATACVQAGGSVQSVPCAQSARACCRYYYQTNPTLRTSCCRNVPVYGSGSLSGTVVGYRCSTMTYAECMSVGGNLCEACSGDEIPAGSDEFGAYYICQNPLP